jgi:hypothetical protein
MNWASNTFLMKLGISSQDLPNFILTRLDLINEENEQTLKAQKGQNPKLNSKLPR